MDARAAIVGRTVRTMGKAIFLGGLVVASGVSATRAQTPSVLPLARFDFPSTAAAQEQWRSPDERTPPARRAADGLLLPCPFGATGADRFYWDQKVRLDLEPYPSLELEVTVDRPEALRGLALYLESGEGWYVWAQPLAHPGRQTITVSRREFSSEGKPAGWDRIVRVRISPWRGTGADAMLTVHSLAARMTPVVLVRGTTSVRDPAERRIAQSVADRIANWLDAMEVPYVAVEDSDAEDALTRARVAILGYNPNLPDAEFRAIQSFAARGGRLIVCYSADEALLKLMGFKFGDYLRAEESGRWSSFVFPEADARDLPARVYQESGNIRSALPDRADARVIAWWEDERGTRTGDPAWTASKHGLWMAHILTEDDALAKQHMLAAMIAGFCPDLWPRIARPAIESAGRIDSFRSMDQAISQLRATADASADRNLIRALLDRAAGLRQDMQRRQEAGDYGDVLGQARIIRATLTEAYARAQHPAPGEFRGIWDHNGVGLFPGDWERTARLLADHGISAVFPNMLWAGLAHYPSAVLPESYTFRRHGDQMEQCVAAAHRNRLQVHAWKVCWNLGTTTDEFRQLMENGHRLQIDADGRTMPWLCPSVAANRKQELDSIVEIARRYGVDGIHLDYIRYPGAMACFCPATRQAFESALGRQVARWPADVRAGGALATRFQEWRADEITAFVRSVRVALQGTKPGLKLSAAVFANYPDCRLSIGQDWGEWLRDGLVDFVCPMTYTESLASFASSSTSHLAIPGARGRVFPGIGVTANESHLLADQAIEQVLAARKAGATGFMLFSLNSQMKEAILPSLRLGVTRP